MEDQNINDTNAGNALSQANSSVNANADQGFFEGIGNAFTGNKDFERQWQLQQQNQAYQYAMSSTAYQRQVQDMKKAGLNPALAATGGLNLQSGEQAAKGKQYDSTNKQKGAGNTVKRGLKALIAALAVLV